VAPTLQKSAVIARVRPRRHDPEGGEGHDMNRSDSGGVQFSASEIGLSQCVWCRHRFEGGDRCRAFPDGIPDAIIKNRHDHCDPYDGDRGVRYEPEIVEIEFVDVETEDGFVPLAAEGPTASGSSGDSDPETEDGVVIDLGDLAAQ
jgi:hypothetical protein